MSKKLQVIVEDAEYQEFQRIAQMRRMSISTWVREALDIARRRERERETHKKMEIIRAAMKHEYPTADLDVMLGEIESGRNH